MMNKQTWAGSENARKIAIVLNAEKRSGFLHVLINAFLCWENC